MGKKKYTTEYFNIRPIISKYDVTYYMIYGEREDGKSYSVKDLIIETVKNGWKFVYLRRTHQQIVRRNMVKVFGDIQDKAEEYLGSKIYFDSQEGFYILENGEHKNIGYATSLQDAMLVKSIPIVDVKIILFDEFIDYTYFQNEISMFLHTISTICRPPNEDVKIFMLGNTISKDCPYFNLFNIDNKKVLQGEVYYLKHTLGVSAVVHHTPSKVSDITTKKKHNKYIGFDDNESVNMIMFGEWEYQHCITKQIDGVGWNCTRHLIPLYVTALGQTYELTIYTAIKIPIAFVRKPNIQLGKCRENIKYNLTYDRTVNLISKSGIVPSFTRLTSFIDSATMDKIKVFNECLSCGRVIFDTIETGSEFLAIYEKIR